MSKCVSCKKSFSSINNATICPKCTVLLEQCIQCKMHYYKTERILAVQGPNKGICKFCFKLNCRICNNETSRFCSRKGCCQECIAAMCAECKNQSSETKQLCSKCKPNRFCAHIDIHTEQVCNQLKHTLEDKFCESHQFGCKYCRKPTWLDNYKCHKCICTNDDCFNRTYRQSVYCRHHLLMDEQYFLLTQMVLVSIWMTTINLVQPFELLLTAEQKDIHLVEQSLPDWLQ